MHLVQFVYLAGNSAHILRTYTTTTTNNSHSQLDPVFYFVDDFFDLGLSVEPKNLDVFYLKHFMTTFLSPDRIFRRCSDRPQNLCF